MWTPGHPVLASSDRDLVDGLYSRVKWPGMRDSTTESEALELTAPNEDVQVSWGCVHKLNG